jgi:hypothetical protein
MENNMQVATSTQLAQLTIDGVGENAKVAADIISKASAEELIDSLPHLNAKAEFCMALVGVVLSKIHEKPSLWKRKYDNWNDFCMQETPWHYSTCRILMGVYEHMIGKLHFPIDEYIALNTQHGYNKLRQLRHIETQEELREHLKKTLTHEQLFDQRTQQASFTTRLPESNIEYIKETVRMALTEAGLPEKTPEKPKDWGKAIFNLCIRYRLLYSAVYDATETSEAPLLQAVQNPTDGVYHVENPEG